MGGVRRYLEESASNVPRDKDGESPRSRTRILADEVGVPQTRRTQIPETAALPPPPESRSLTPPLELPSAGPSQPSPSQKRSIVPGSVVDETPAALKPLESTAMDIDEPPPPTPSAPAPASAQPTASGRKVS